LESNELGYLVVCLNLNKTYYCRFELEINSDQKLKKVVQNSGNNQKKLKYELKGKWTEATSGGPPEDFCFMKNPKYSFTTRSQLNSIKIEISIAEKYLVGIIMEEAGSIKNENKLKRVFSLKEQTNCVQANITSNLTYVLIPFTGKPKQLTAFTITIHADEDINLKELI
jgi:hypothetical protein